jgi:hypothetical protein
VYSSKPFSMGLGRTLKKNKTKHHLKALIPLHVEETVIINPAEDWFSMQLDGINLAVQENVEKHLIPKPPTTMIKH